MESNPIESTSTSVESSLKRILTSFVNVVNKISEINNAKMISLDINEEEFFFKNESGGLFKIKKVNSDWTKFYNDNDNNNNNNNNDNEDDEDDIDNNDPTYVFIRVFHNLRNKKAFKSEENDCITYKDLYLGKLVVINDEGLGIIKTILNKAFFSQNKKKEDDE